MYGLIALNFIIPFVMVFVGYILKKHPVKDMTSGNGYNTPTSRKSQEHWDYAQSIAPYIFTRAADYFVGVAFGAYRNVAHRRVGAYRARPRHGQQVILFGRRTAAHQHSRQRIDQRPGFPALLHRRRQLAFAKKLRKNTI